MVAPCVVIAIVPFNVIANPLWVKQSITCNGLLRCCAPRNDVQDMTARELVLALANQSCAAEPNLLGSVAEPLLSCACTMTFGQKKWQKRNAFALKSLKLKTETSLGMETKPQCQPTFWMVGAAFLNANSRFCCSVLFIGGKNSKR